MLDTIDSSNTWALTREELGVVLHHSERGSVVVYAVGDLQTTRQFDTRWEAIGKYTNELKDEGKGYLTQKRLGPHRYEYRIEKR